VLFWFAVPPKLCLVSFTGPTGIRHSVEVVAETLFEAAALGLRLLRQTSWADGVAPGANIEVQVREPATTHTVTVHQIRRWCDGVAVSPDEVLKRRKVKELLDPPVAKAHPR
jgi:hypothetical protein